MSMDNTDWRNARGETRMVRAPQRGDLLTPALRFAFGPVSDDRGFATLLHRIDRDDRRRY